MSIYELNTNTDQSLEDYLKSFLEASVKTLWPRGWMQSRWCSDGVFSLSTLENPHWRILYTVTDIPMMVFLQISLRCLQMMFFPMFLWPVLQDPAAWESESSHSRHRCSVSKKKKAESTCWTKLNGEKKQIPVCVQGEEEIHGSSEIWKGTEVSVYKW